MVNKAFRDWASKYDKERTDPFNEYGSDSTLKDDLSAIYPDAPLMSPDEIRSLPVPGMFDDRHGYQIPLTVGQCCEALRKTWYRYRCTKDIDAAWRILRLQKSMNRELACFNELDMDQAKHELEMEFGEYRQQEIK